MLGEDVDDDGSDGTGSNPDMSVTSFNPLQIDNVLERVLYHSSFKDLANFRQVSCQWHREAMESWRNKAVLRILGEGSTEDSGGITLENLGEILSSIENGLDGYNLSLKPFRCYELNGFKKISETTFNIDSEECGTIRKLFNFGRVAHLTLSNCEFASVKSFGALVFTTLPYLEGLKIRGSIEFKAHSILDFEQCTPRDTMKRLTLEHTTKFVYPMRFPWEQFFERMPQLKELQINAKYKNVEEEVSQILTAVERVRETDNTKTLLNIKSLEEFSVNTALEPAVPVEFHEVTPYHPTPTLHGLERLSTHISLSSLAESVTSCHPGPYLVTLKFVRVSIECGNPGEAVYPYKDPIVASAKFPQLKEFRIIDIRRFTLRAFQFLIKIDAPVLEKIVLEKGFDSEPVIYGEPRDDELFLQQLHEKVFERLHTFEFHGEQFVLSKIYLEALSRTLPNLKRLNIPLSTSTFPTVCQGWPKLDTLKILQAEVVINAGEELNDEVILGICPIASYAPGPAKVPNITNLQELTDLVICCNRGESKLTGESATYGFLQLPLLHHLNVTFREITAEVKSALEAKINYLEIKVQNEIEVTD